MSELDDLYADIAPPAAPVAADDDLYADMDETPRLPSNVELRRSLSSAVERRQELEVQAKAHESQFNGDKERVQDLTRRVCVLLKTARLEIQRKEEQLRAEARRGSQSHHRTPHGNRDDAPPRHGQGGSGGGGSSSSADGREPERHRGRDRGSSPCRPRRRSRSRSRSPDRRRTNRSSQYE